MNPSLRAKENLHVLFWLFKDFAWLIDFKALGIAMAVPTLLLSLWLTWKSKGNESELFHNLAITSWICANAIWMFGEFYFQDGIRHIALPFFIVGIGFVSYYYLKQWVKLSRNQP
jgi:hypothetical protein